MSAVTDLISFWQRCDLAGPPFVHPDDRPVLQKYGRQYIDDEPKDFAAFVSSSRFGDFTDRRLHLSLLPSPYCGNLREADIVILLLNPGFAFSDYYAETRMPKFRHRIVQTLAQNFDGIDFPFFPLDPEYCWYGGFRWWEEKLRDVITVIANKKFNRRYLDALHDVSKRLASLELVPYHSSSFNAHPLINERNRAFLPSVGVARRFAKEALGKALDQRDKTFIVTRQVEAWGLSGQPEKPPTLILYKGVETRGARLGRETRGGQAILARYGISGD
jgi:hypothetical protein